MQPERGSMAGGTALRNSLLATRRTCYRGACRTRDGHERWKSQDGNRRGHAKVLLGRQAASAVRSTLERTGESS